MAEDVRLSPQTVVLLAALLEAPGEWQYGYDLSRRTGLKSGTLYPILMRLNEREWLETKWQIAEGEGKPRHMYRLTAEGRRRARVALKERVGKLRRLEPHTAR